MGKKGSWFSAIKGVFLSNSKDKLTDGLDKKDAKEKKKKGQQKLKTRPSFFPRSKEPSSIEKILGEAERERHLINFRPITTPSFTPSQSTNSLHQYSPPRVASTRERVPDSPSNDGSTSQRAFVAPEITSPQRTNYSPQNSTRKEAVSPLNAGVSSGPTSPRPEPTLRYQNNCATKIQATYRGYVARKSYRSRRGLVRLQGVVKGQSVRRQTANAMRCMQLLVRVQTQIQSRRLQMLENQTVQRQKADSSQYSENGNPDDWDDSRLTKEEIDARTHRKHEAITKRQRAMAYAYSNQAWKASPKTPQGALTDIRFSGGYPYWWNWLDKSNPNPNPSESQTTKNTFSTPPRPSPSRPTSCSAQPSPTPTHSRPRFTTSTSNSTKPRATYPKSLPFGSRFKDDESLTSCPAFSAPRFMGSGHEPRDDESLTSCPAFSGPRYMQATASAKARLGLGFEDSPEPSKRRGSFPMARAIGSFKWNRRGSLFSAMSTPSSDHRGAKKDMMSVDSGSTHSMATSVGRKPFNRFV